MKVSPSQISNFETCETKWYLESVEKVHRPDTEATLLGTACHKALEYWLEHGKWDPFEDPRVLSIVKAAEASPLYHSLIGKGRIEEGAGFFYKGVHFNGRIDLNWPDPKEVGHGYVLDHKTSKDFKWAKTPDSAYSDVQTVIYAISCLIQYGWTSVTVIYGYFSTARPRPVHPVYAERHTMETLLPLLEERMVQVERMKQLREIGTVTAASKNLDGCYKFGGCPHKDRCFNSSSQVDPFADAGDGNTGDNIVFNFLDHLATNNVPAAPAPAPAAPPTPAQPAAPAFSFAVPQVQQPAQQPQAPTPPPAPAAVPQAFAFAAPVAPAAAPAAPAAPAPAPAPAAPAAPAPVAAAPAPVAGEAPAPVATPAEAPPARKRRRTKKEMEEARAAAAASGSNEPVDESTDEAAADAVPAVYFGCVPLGVETVTIEQFLDSTGLVSQYEKREGVPHYSAKPYNEGARHISGVLIAKILSGEVQLPPHLIVGAGVVWAALLRGEITRLGDAVRVVLSAA